MAIRKAVWIYPNANPTIGTHFENTPEHSMSSVAELDYIRVTGYIGVTGGNQYLYAYIPVVENYVIQSGDYLEYDIYLETGPGNIQFAMDMHSSAGALRDGGATDQNGLGAHPSTDISSVAYGKWYRRRIPVTNFSGGSSIGTTVTYFNLVAEADTLGTYYARFKNIAITDGNGVAIDNRSSFLNF